MTVADPQQSLKTLSHIVSGWVHCKIDGIENKLHIIRLEIKFRELSLESRVILPSLQGYLLGASE